MLSVEIAGPNSVAPGETAQFSATAILTGGTSRDVTNEATWTSSLSGVLPITGPGLAVGRERGEATIAATLNGFTSSRNVIVVPAGTYRLAGRVIESEGSSFGVADARIEVTTGGGAGLSTTALVDGTYRLYGVSGETNLRVTRTGYQPQTLSINVLNHETLDIVMPLSAPRRDVSGTYTLTITSADTCERGGGQLPEDARVRKYVATVTQSGPALQVRLTGASFPVFGGLARDRFFGSAQPEGVGFSLNLPDDFDWPDVLEQLSPSVVFVPQGAVVTSWAADGLRGTLDGTLHVLEGDEVWPFQRHLGWCSSATHRFVLSR